MATLNYRNPMRQAHDVVVHAQSAFWADEDVNRKPKFERPDHRLDVTCTTEMTTTVGDSMMLQVDLSLFSLKRETDVAQDLDNHSVVDREERQTEVGTATEKARIGVLD